MGEVTFEVQLGSCFYGGLDCDAVYVGRKDGDSGWISVCEEHKGEAEQDGYELMEPKETGEVPDDGEYGDPPADRDSATTDSASADSASADSGDSGGDTAGP